MCDYSSVTRTAGRAEERTLPLINTNNADEKTLANSRQAEGQTFKTGEQNQEASLRTRFFYVNQAYLFLIAGARAGFGVLFLAIVRQCGGCSGIRRVLSAAFMCGCSLETQ
jgi:hypothetical protein